MEIKKPRHVAVIGLGVFGSNVVRYLYELGVEILGIDKDERKVENVKQYLKLPVVADATDPKQLQDAGVTSENIDVAIIGIGENVETSIYVTLLLKEAGINRVIARALNNQHAKILAKIGVDRIVYPEANAAEQLSRSLVAPNIIEEFELSPEYSITEIVSPKSFYNKSLKELDVRAKYKVIIIAIKRKTPVLVDETGETDLKEEIILVPNPEEEIIEGDTLIIAGKNEDINKLRSLQ
jgi:trk system potassium uptake protein TrkA